VTLSEAIPGGSGAASAAVDPSGDDPVGDYVARSAEGPAFDEIRAADGSLHPHWAALSAHYRTLGGATLQRLQADVRLQLEQDGVTFNPAPPVPGAAAVDPVGAVAGTGSTRRPRPWSLDVAPLMLAAEEWAEVERGLEQRAHLLNVVLADLFGPRHLVRDGTIPLAMVLADPAFHRACHGINVQGDSFLPMAAVDLFRDRDGAWRSYGHRTQLSAGMAYALENRRILGRVFPTLFRSSGVRRLAPFVRALRSTIQAAAPPEVENPSVVVLSPGPLSETAFEHAAIATRLGYPLVEGGDLRIHEGRVWLRTVSGLLPVHVILRQIPTASCDPLELWPGSTIGVPGLVDACRAGTVAVINPLGSGLAGGFGLLSILPTVAQRVLDEDLRLPPVGSWWCGDPSARSHVLANLDALVLRPLSRWAPERAIDARRVSVGERDELRARIEAQPERWVGQEPIEPSTAPVLVGRGLHPRPTVLRGFTVADDDRYRVMPGGLARSAPVGVLNEGERFSVGGQLGLVTKDTWVLGVDATPDGDLGPVRISAGSTDQGATVERMPARAVENLFWLGRYAERAEATVRLLRVVNQRRADFEGVDSGPGREALEALLEATTRFTTSWPGFVGDDAEARLADPGPELFALVADRERPGTVAYSIDRLMAALDVVRDQQSIDTWLVVGSVQRRIEDLDPDASNRDESVGLVLDDLLHRLLSLSGLATESMVRDQGWQVMDAGRRIERALRLVSLVVDTLGRSHGPITEGLVLESVAMATESIITYRRRYVWQARVATLLELLFLDAGNPRSLRFQVDRLGDALAGLPQSGIHGRALSVTEALAALEREVAALDSAALAVPDDDQQRVRLVETAGRLQSLLAGLADAVAADYFARQVPQRSVSTPVERPWPKDRS
jgi:uncharacterized circularly permuted ATP-grasp superfamily protein/uncharacterized alpha-E superfamily protein